MNPSRVRIATAARDTYYGDVNYGSQRGSKCCEIEDIIITGCCEKFAINRDSFVTPRESCVRDEYSNYVTYVFMILNCTARIYGPSSALNITD